ncbi:uncharacterized protein LOC126203556 [Schistocerca nitens]|uniref:uncharacterized protein LOC126203556 n=1 Tax=Schistocerca nitens TaxID=7011 RepID=UPI002118684B|nr:uncharacterized protein LOC126203556 [Schistocerca nitens]
MTNQHSEAITRDRMSIKARTPPEKDAHGNPPDSREHVAVPHPQQDMTNAVFAVVILSVVAAADAGLLTLPGGAIVSQWPHQRQRRMDSGVPRTFGVSGVKVAENSFNPVVVLNSTGFPSAKNPIGTFHPVPCTQQQTPFCH